MVLAVAELTIIMFGTRAEQPVGSSLSLEGTHAAKALHQAVMFKPALDMEEQVRDGVLAGARGTGLSCSFQL